jgi:protein-S-isoprenylcysteine O-methyltransferase Ste14
MNELLFFNYLIVVSLVSGFVVCIVLFFIPAPYGRHVKKGWGLQIDNKVGWIVMESVSPLGFALLFFLGDWKEGFLPYLFLSLWLVHYLYRSLLFPLLIRGKKQMPLLIMVFAIVFNLMNSYLQGRHLYHFSMPYSADWFLSAPFTVGIILFITGFVIHVSSDTITRRLREPGQKEYKIPHGGLYRWISSPNYLGEIIEWIGWAVLTWSIPGLVFAFWTAANLVPRAYSNHQWYVKTFPDYPRERKALIPRIF